MKKIAYLNLLLLMALTSCGGSGSGPASGARGDLVSAMAKSSYSQQDIESRSNGYLTTPIKHGARTVKLVYKTQDSQGNIINVSGLLALPVKEPAADSPIMVYHHPTIFNDDHAPSNFSSLDLFAALLTSQDYIVLMPDYIGYGESAALLHPYVHANSLAVTSVDMLRAAKTYLQQENVGVQDKLFLTGYSEGGYAALAAHKLIESNYSNEFSVTASVPGAGSYDLTTTLNNHLINGSLVNLGGLVFAFTAYDSIYNMNRLPEFFKPPYDELAATAFYGDMDEATIQAPLSNITSVSDLFTDTFLSNYAAVDGELFLKAKVAENDIYDWKPVAPIRFYHGEFDEVVPIDNADTAKQAMDNTGDVDVLVTRECILTSNAHNGCVGPYIRYLLEYFGSFQ